MPRPSGTRHRPARARSSGRAPFTRRPATTTSPPVAGCSPASTRSVVVLPAPFGPSTRGDRPAGTARSMPCSTSMRAVAGPQRRAARPAARAIARPRSVTPSPRRGRRRAPRSSARISVGACRDGEHAADVEHVDLVAHRQHERHVVLDEHAPPSPRRPARAGAGRTRRSRPRRGPTPARRGAAPTARRRRARASSTRRAWPVGQLVGPDVGHRADADPLEQRVGDVVAGCRRAHRGAGQVGRHPDVVVGGEHAEQLEALERAGQAERGPAWVGFSPVTSRSPSTTRPASAAGGRR